LRVESLEEAVERRLPLTKKISLSSIEERGNAKPERGCCRYGEVMR
jgi:hypothetical protein